MKQESVQNNPFKEICGVVLNTHFYVSAANLSVSIRSI